MIKINGESFESDTIKLLDYISENNMDPKKIAVECNEEIIPRSTYDSVAFKSGDIVEIVSLVGGG